MTGLRGAELRVWVALCAATVAVLICLHQRHFVLSLADPRSFLVMSQHRCGRVLMASVGWAFAETAWYGWTAWRLLYHRRGSRA